MRTVDPQLEARILGREWFYEFELPSGKRTRSYLPDEVKSIHRTRERMVFDYLDRRVAGRWSELRCLDIGCHEGYFALQLARRGCRQVLGIDARDAHVADAALVRDVYGLENLTFQRGNILELTNADLGRFDIVLLLGLLYHVPDIVGALNAARALTAGTCVIETQVAPELPATVEWGSRQWTKAIQGSFALVDETEELGTGNAEASVESISFVPSRNALKFLLPRVGFDRVEFLPPPANGNEQMVRGVRVAVAASVPGARLDGSG